MAFAVLIGIIGLIFSKDILAVVGATKEGVEYGHVYTKIMLGGNIVILLLFLTNGIFRGAGDAVLAMRSLWPAARLPDAATAAGLSTGHLPEARPTGRFLGYRHL